MNEHPFKAFIDLISFDQKTVETENLVQQLQEEVGRFESEIQLFNKQVKSAESNVYDVRKEVDSHELHMKEYDQQAEFLKKRLDAVANQKEYQSIRKEIDTVKKQQYSYEEIILETWNKLEAAQRDFEEHKKEMAAKIEALQKMIVEKKETIEKLSAEIDQRHQVRKSQEQGIPAEWLERYAMMRVRVTNPVVPVIDGQCSACFYQIHAQDMILLRRHKLLLCKDCYRFLYLETPATTTV